MPEVGILRRHTTIRRASVEGPDADGRAPSVVSLCVPMSSEAAFRRVGARMREKAGTEEGRAFHAPGLKVGGRLFAMLVDEQLVVKLPAHRCTEIVEDGAARRFSSGGREMKEWVAVPYSDTSTWTALADEARRFVGGGRGRASA